MTLTPAAHTEEHTMSTTTPYVHPATDHEMLRHYGMEPRDTIGTDLTITNVEARILAELVGAEERECWDSSDPRMAKRLANLVQKLLAAAAAGDAEAAA